METVAWKHIHYHVKQIASGNLLYDAGSSNPVLSDNLEGCHGGGRLRREGTDVCLWLIPVDV